MTKHDAIQTPLTWNRSQILIRARRSDTAGAIGIFETVDQPGDGPPLHVHDDADETFVILSGEAEFSLNGKRSHHGVGATIFVPRGAEHAYRAIGSAPLRMLTIMTPGGFEAFFAEIAERNYRIPEDMQKVVEIAARYHVRFTGPPLADAS